MVSIHFKPTFIRQFNKLEKRLQDEIEEKLGLFKDVKNHSVLKVHKLQGQLSGFHSFSVNYRYRIVFAFNKKKQEAVLHTIGDHSVYN